MKQLPGLTLLLLSLVPATVYSQETGSTSSPAFVIPSGRVLNPAPNFSRWTIAFSYPEDQSDVNRNAPAGPAKKFSTRIEALPRTSITTKTGTIIHEEMTTVAGSKTEEWEVDGNCYVKFPGYSIWSVYDSSSTTEASTRARAELSLPSSGFRGLDWITKETYAGRMTTEWGDCFVFLPGGHEASKEKISKEKLDTAPIVACVDAQTRLPVMVRAMDGTRLFTFTQPPPTSMLSLPDALTSEIKAAKAMQAQRNAAPSREY